jgi:GNAT superfamily N-acetyltransferase
MTAIVKAESPGDLRATVEVLLEQFMTDRVGKPQREPFALAIVDERSSQTLGGLWAMSLWGSFYINVVFVPEEMRARGLGTELLRRAEEEAEARDCWHMWLDTYDFEARPFYERLGWELFGQLQGPAPYYPRHFMRKVLRRGIAAQSS